MIWLDKSISFLKGNKMFLVMAGGAIGSYLRYFVSKWIGNQSWSEGFPFATMLINISGSFILALVAVIVVERLPSEHAGWYLLLGTGFCGGFTTFSTFEWETYQLVRDGSWILGLGNVVGSVVGGFAGVLLAVVLVGLMSPRN